MVIFLSQQQLIIMCVGSSYPLHCLPPQVWRRHLQVPLPSLPSPSNTYLFLGRLWPCLYTPFVGFPPLRPIIIDSSPKARSTPIQDTPCSLPRLPTRAYPPQGDEQTSTPKWKAVEVCCGGQAVAAAAAWRVVVVTRVEGDGWERFMRLPGQPLRVAGASEKYLSPSYLLPPSDICLKVRFLPDNLYS